jgi:hypothetical protein
MRNSSFHSPRRRSQVVRQRSAKPPFDGSTPSGASRQRNDLGPLRRAALGRLGRSLGRSRAQSCCQVASLSLGRPFASTAGTLLSVLPDHPRPHAVEALPSSTVMTLSLPTFSIARREVAVERSTGTVRAHSSSSRRATQACGELPAPPKRRARRSTGNSADVMRAAISAQTASSSQRPPLTRSNGSLGANSSSTDLVHVGYQCGMSQPSPVVSLGSLY